MSEPAGQPIDELDEVLASGGARRIARLADDGTWTGGFSAGAEVDALDVIFRTVLGAAEQRHVEGVARSIRRRQNEDFSWSTFAGGPGSPSVTLYCYLALRIAGDRPDDPRMAGARAFLRSRQVLSNLRAGRVWLAMLGLASWDDMPLVPLRLVRRSHSLSARLAPWARTLLLPIAVCMQVRPTVAPVIDAWEMAEIAGDEPRRPARRGRASRTLKALLRYRREDYVDAVTANVVREVDPNGLVGGFIIHTYVTLIALRHLPGDATRDVEASMWAAIEAHAVRQGEEVTISFADTTVGDTALAVRALASVDRDRYLPAIRPAVRWLIAAQIDRGPETGAWAWEIGNRSQPDADTTSIVGQALSLVADELPEARAAIEAAAAWCASKQRADGAWTAYESRGTGIGAVDRVLARHDLLEPPSTDITGHVVEWISGSGAAGPYAAQLRRGGEWIRRDQGPDGSWAARWEVGHGFAVHAAVGSLLSLGCTTDDPSLALAARWLLDTQNADGGWGESPLDAVERFPSTVQQTSVCLEALARLVPAGHPAIAHAVEFLVQHFSPTEALPWDEPWFVCIAAPSAEFYWHDELYPTLLAIAALANARPSGAGEGTG